MKKQKVFLCTLALCAFSFGAWGQEHLDVKSRETVNNISKFLKKHEGELPQNLVENLEEARGLLLKDASLGRLSHSQRTLHEQRIDCASSKLEIYGQIYFRHFSCFTDCRNERKECKEGCPEGEQCGCGKQSLGCFSACAGDALVNIAISAGSVFEVAPSKSPPYWTPWLNRDSPGGKGDFELRKDFQEKGELCDNPIKIVCETMSGVPAGSTGQKYDCDLNKGGICINENQKGERCHNYRVKFLCP